jgi:hypothetical protein
VWRGIGTANDLEWTRAMRKLLHEGDRNRYTTNRVPNTRCRSGLTHQRTYSEQRRAHTREKGESNFSGHQTTRS